MMTTANLVVQLLTLILIILSPHTDDNTYFQQPNPGPGGNVTIDTLFDIRDGRQYEVILLDSLWWFNESLAYSTTTSSESPHRGNVCGSTTRLYTFYESEVVCPDGWRLPSVAELDDLLLFLSESEHTGIVNLTLSWTELAEQHCSIKGFRFEQTGLLNKKSFRSPESFNIWLANNQSTEAHHVHMYAVQEKNNRGRLSIFRHSHEQKNPIRNKRKLAVRCVCSQSDFNSNSH